MIRAAYCLALALFTCSAWAHKPSDSYLSIEVAGDRLSGQWDIALRDLDFAIGLDSSGDGEITWGEVRGRHNDIAAYALARLTAALDGAACPLQATQHLVDLHSDGTYAVIRFEGRCAKPGSSLELGYNLFFDLDPQHKGLLRLQYAGTTRAAIFSPETARQTFELKQASRFTQFIDYGREGVWHIWKGFDHILFLLSLLLPAVLIPAAKHAVPHGGVIKGWRAVDEFKPAFWEVFQIVTAFTIAHSITLSLAALGVITLPTRLTESAIALSVILAALNNLYPLFQRRRWMVAFAFGLIHGFGFASVLADLGLPPDALLLALVGFNLGVEVGQLCIVSAFLPTAYVLRRTALYQRVVFIGGSAVICVIALVWFLERAFNLKLLVL
ncbi:MAG: HupE/UreJ family protein [Betaproteobacteria bacterium]|nr:HupE/UreJ family protein [Betaproteobacteria bacterium]